ncbi:MAG: peptide deformylase [Cyanobacteria bacterium J083]|nr:MAG: peptide deformylase [Cyanobacteria bacterium J083]
MTEYLTIAELGNPILRQPANMIDEMPPKRLQKLIDSLLITMKKYQGVGIAAPQVEEPYRLFIVASHPNQRYPSAPIMFPTPMLNPHLLNQSEEKIKDWEGCLSIPGLRGLVPRAETIEVEYLDRQGVVNRQIFTGFIARVIQHELDHLDGKLFIDRIETTQDLYTETEYQKIIEQNRKNQ